MSKKNCPQKQFISVYHDGAMPSPWKEKLEEHLSSCKDCADTLASYRAASAILKHDDCGDQLLAAKDRVIQKIQNSNSYNLKSHSIYNTHTNGSKRNILSRSIDVPLPFAAAAAAVFVLALSALFVNRQNQSELAKSGATGNSILPVSYASDEVQEYGAAANMSEVLNYLNTANDSQDIVIIKLTEKNSFSRIGEPKLFNVADYYQSSKAQNAVLDESQPQSSERNMACQRQAKDYKR
ncbi:MAG: hypothetical protein Ta2B_01280 [Termitinemataceae bacterium]|nr:MAG: hypothetical protein Ta2B_01280 [Termitinemataceae bacterium]